MISFALLSMFASAPSTLIPGGDRIQAVSSNTPHTEMQLVDRCHQSNVAHGTCLPNGRLNLNFSHAEDQCVLLRRGGRGEGKLCFCPRGNVQVGMQSRVLFDSLGKWVLKVRGGKGPHTAFQPKREACFLRRLRDVAWAPQLLCHSKQGMVFEAVGEPVSPRNLPYDWQAQTATILTDLHARGIRHNDIWRMGGFTTWMYGGTRIEVMVRRTGRLSLVDFGWATSNDGWRCGDDVDDQGIHPQLSMYGTADVAVSHLLAQYEALRDDAGLNQINSSLSFCGSSSVTLPTPDNDGSPLSRIESRINNALLHLVRGDCTRGNLGYFDMPAPSKFDDLGKDGTGWGPDKANAFGTFGNHLRACMAACQSCPQCAAFTPSELTGKCHWSSTCKPLTDGDAPVWHGDAIPTFSRGVRSPSAALRAIIDAPAGHCGGTDVSPYAPPSCAKEALGRGGWHLRELVGNLTETGPLAAAGLTPDIVARCAAACAVCSTCAFFSVSLYNDDCSWYASCEGFTARRLLSTIPRGYRTFQMPLERSQSNNGHRAAGGKGRGKSRASAKRGKRMGKRDAIA